jgi:hypothetical protein
MTAQVAEKLILDGQRLRLCELPLTDYFALSGLRPPKFRVETTANWRGYVGTWEIKNSRLYLVNIAGVYEDGSPATLDSLFPGFPDRVFAHWYSGALRIPQGELLKYRHMGWASVHERDLLIDVQDGVIREMSVRVNKVPITSGEDK